VGFFLGDAGFDKSVTSRNQLTIRTEPSLVGTMPPNQYGLCDVLGNVWEWCADSDSPGQKVLKGGAYDNQVSFHFRTLERTTALHVFADNKASDMGFRCVLVRQPQLGMKSED
jgi:formylglycine-generating enzyme required for sulfatase activity